MILKIKREHDNEISLTIILDNRSNKLSYNNLIELLRITDSQGISLNIENAYINMVLNKPNHFIDLKMIYTMFPQKDDDEATLVITIFCDNYSNKIPQYFDFAHEIER